MDVTDDYIRKRLQHTIDTLPVPWEQLLAVFQRVMQNIPQNQKVIKKKTAERAEIEMNSKKIK